MTHWSDAYLSEPSAYDEMHVEGGTVRVPYERVNEFLKKYTTGAFREKEKMAGNLFLNRGITFTVYSEKEGIERIFPFDIIPRIITASEWAVIEAGIKQRLKALNLFLKDIYHNRQILNDGVIPAALIASCPHYTRDVYGIRVPHDIYVHISGIDLIRDADGTFYVLEDNLRTPSGVSYMLENREITKRIFPDLIATSKVRSISDYPLLLHKVLSAVAPRDMNNPTVVLMTPGIYNSAYYEHTFLAKYMGIELVEGRDLVVQNDRVYMKSTSGLKQVDVIYRRVDDDFLDPLVFRPDSTLGVAGLLNVCRKGNVSIVNAVGNGVADDKAVYRYVPKMIEYYLNETPILKNVPTYSMENEEERAHVISNISKMVVKKTNESGGYGLLMGDKASDAEIAETITAISENPRNFIAQPIITLSTAPCFIDNKLQARHVDLRPYALCGPGGVEIVPGGLTRVALREGSKVVNSSQGGGSKDTWIVNDTSFTGSI
ncbi:circularly permuted type 2 ATP-grasp protein [Niabella pedocola]|uniref:Circularly permuted type 2 ATP-grasp protein n=1 Tax=Niabella pedocola TaxID=1752077 RepID=A0ABS8PPG7_9BACT|nr:circularly permuted type 2 ATP-grasp protein [Niabella pedocola]MCD2422740.1 circularly permuted type 2 ATP-grasp protein [Niabella pedocola]